MFIDIKRKKIVDSHHRLPYFRRKDENRFLCKAVRTVTLMPGEYISVKLPPFLQNEETVVAAPTRENPSNFITPGILNVE